MKLIWLLLILLPIEAFAAAGDNFRPCQTIAISATGTSSTWSIGACGAATLNLDCHNTGSVEVFITGGVGTAIATVPTGTAAAGNYHLGAGMDKVFDLGAANTVAVITASSTATVYCSTGGGQ